MTWCWCTGLLRHPWRLRPTGKPPAGCAPRPSEVGRLAWRHALHGAVAAALLWELARHLLVWYFTTLSQLGIVYGSLTTAIAVLLSLQVGATLLLLGAQVIAEYERLAVQVSDVPPVPTTTTGA